MRVGILTFHRALNYGAVIQSYALQRTVSRLGADCEIIDYRCMSLEAPYRPLYVHEPSLKGLAAMVVYLPVRLLRRAKFAAFRRKHLRVSVERYVRETIASANGSYDCFVVGSDQVWNPDLTAGDATYFLDFVEEGERKASYAASLGKSSSMRLYAETYRARLSDFGAISVRERDSCEYLGALLSRDVSWVLDPVLLARPNELGGIAQSPAVKGPYIFAYCLHESAMYRYLEHLRKLTGLQVVYVPESIRTHLQGTRAMVLSPEEFLGYIRDADYVVTDSYHVVVLSIVFKRNFKAQLKRELPELNARLTSLLGQLNLQEQFITELDYEGTTLPCVDYERVSGPLSDASRRSLEYLQSIFDSGTVSDD